MKMLTPLILGVDLSGPANEGETAVVSVRMTPQGLEFLRSPIRPSGGVSGSPSVTNSPIPRVPNRKK